MKFLVTGAAGFIGHAVSHRLLEAGHSVCGIDNLNDYYAVSLKLARLARLQAYPAFQFSKLDITDRAAIQQLFAREQFQRVIHLAAQAGVRYSLQQPHACARANLLGQLNILEGCRQQHVEHLLYASSSSVYGLNRKLPFSVQDSTDHPVSFYAASKKANELMAHSYSHLYQLPTTGMRFFTVYGPWGRPDMALFKFTKAILQGEPLNLYNHGNMRRDFTYIDDVAEVVMRLQQHIPAADNQWNVEQGSRAASSAPYRLYNIGNGNPLTLMDFLAALENALGIKAIKQHLPPQPGDVQDTSADTSDLHQLIGYRPNTPVPTGITHFTNWYRAFYAGD